MQHLKKAWTKEIKTSHFTRFYLCKWHELINKSINFTSVLSSWISMASFFSSSQICPTISIRFLQQYEIVLCSMTCCVTNTLLYTRCIRSLCGLLSLHRYHCLLIYVSFFFLQRM